MADPVEAAAEAIAAQGFQDMGLPAVQWQRVAETVKTQYRVYAEVALAAADAARMKTWPDITDALETHALDDCDGTPVLSHVCMKAAALITSQQAEIERLKAALTGRSASEDEDKVGCESCSAQIDIENAVSMEDCYFCQKCYAEWLAVFEACDHDWQPHVDEMGDDAKYCTKCCGVVPVDDESAARAAMGVK